jgi:septation ring formation regulator EzrA
MDDELRDRLTRVEQDVKNQKENFQSFKSDDFGALKREVHSMRDEFNEKLDQVIEQLNKINLTMAKWVGMGTVLLVGAEFALKKLLG